MRLNSSPPRVLALVLFMVLTALPLHARTITDMAGRTVTIPDQCTKIFCASPPALYLLYALDHRLAAGLNFSLSAQESTYLHPEFANLPLLGGWFGQGNTPNMESILAAKPDFLLAWYWRQDASNDVVENAAKTLKLPVVYVQLNTLEEYARAFTFLGRLVGREKRGKILAAETRRILREVQPVVDAVPEAERVSVYYAQGPDGLKTECNSSVHAALIEMAGGRNIRVCEARNNFGMESVGIEEVLVGNPQVILSRDRTFTANVLHDPVWRHLRAVRDARVLDIPSEPFNWFDRPPSFMRILGLVWLTNVLYPERYPKDMVTETRRFYNLFLGVELDDAETRRVLGK